MDIKIKLLAIPFLGIVGCIIIISLIVYIVPMYGNVDTLLDVTNLWIILLFAFVISVWIYMVIRLMQSIYKHARHGSIREQEKKGLGKERENLENVMGVAKKEFLKRNISKDTFEDIQKTTGKKLVEIKAREKELEKPKKEEEISK